MQSNNDPHKLWNKWQVRTITYLICLIILAILTTACSPRVITNTEYRDRIEYRDRYKTDSIHIRDSIYIKEKGDTIYLYKWRTEYRDRLLRDTLTIQHTDSIPYRVEVERKLTRWQRTCIRHYPYALGAIALLALYALRKPILKLIKLII